MPWYCARTIGRHTRAAFYLRRAGVRYCCPEVHKYGLTPRDRARNAFRVSALFPGYCFVRLDNDEDRAKALGATGVHRLLGHWTGETYLLAEIAPDWIEAVEKAGPLVVGKKAPFKPGNRVKLAIGRLAEAVGQVEGLDADKVIAVKLTMFGAERVVRVDPSHVQDAEWP